MSSDKIKQYFEHIQLAASRIESFVAGMTLEDFEDDIKTMSAVERQLSVISEAAYRLGDNTLKFCLLPDWKQIRGIGNVLRHDYSEIAADVIWGTATKDVPALRKAVEQTLREHFPPTT